MNQTSQLLLTCSLFLISSCFNGYNDKVSEEEENWACGTIDGSSMNNAPIIFKAKCSTCHHLTKDGTGPKLIGALERAPSEKWLRQFITNEDSLLQIKDSAALALQDLKPTIGMH